MMPGLVYMQYKTGGQYKRKLLCFIFGYVGQQSHLSTRCGSLLVRPPVKLLQHILVWRCRCVDELSPRSHTHHQDLLTVRGLAHNKGIILEVRHHRHQRNATAAAPAPPLHQQSSSQQSRAHCDRGGGGERRWCWTAGDSRGLQIWTVWNNH